jgi:phosphopantothenate---cysteine ligase (ATP)
MRITQRPIPGQLQRRCVVDSASIVRNRPHLARKGTRGATSAEYFLKAGYAVIFMHRQFSLQPFSRHYSHSTNPFLDFLDISMHHDCGMPPSDARTVDDGVPLKPGIDVTPSKRADLLSVLSQYKRVQREGTLHTLTFVTVNDYLWLLRAVSQVLGRGRRRALYYLAAAVSDFFLPRQKLVRLLKKVVRCLASRR